VKPLDAIKLALLLVSLTTWFIGWRAGSPVVMKIAIGIMALAFLLRFLKRPANPAAAQ
jgi:hypothetical protein